MSTSFRFSLLLARLAFLAAFPLGFGTHIVHAQQQLYPSLKDSVPSITTNGVASAEVVPDIATISIGVDTERPNAADAARDNARATQAVVGEIKAQGIEAKDIITLSPVYDESTDANGRIIKRTLRGYSAHNSLSVRIRDITKAGTLASQLMACAETPFATPCARPVATSMGSALSSGGSSKSRQNRRHLFPLGCRRECSARARAKPPLPRFPSSRVFRRCALKCRSLGNLRSNKRR
jgi:hypothetical protein